MYSAPGDLHHAYMRKPLAPRKTATAFRMTFIRNWRNHRKRTLEELADKIGITHASLSRIETGKQPYSQPILEALAEELATDVPSLLSRDPGDPDAIWPIWDQAKPSERQMIVDIAKTVVKPRG